MSECLAKAIRHYWAINNLGKRQIASRFSISPSKLTIKTELSWVYTWHIIGRRHTYPDLESCTPSKMSECLAKAIRHYWAINNLGKRQIASRFSISPSKLTIKTELSWVYIWHIIGRRHTYPDLESCTPSKMSECLAKAIRHYWAINNLGKRQIASRFSICPSKLTIKTELSWVYTWHIIGRRHTYPDLESCTPSKMSECLAKAIRHYWAINNLGKGQIASRILICPSKLTIKTELYWVYTWHIIGRRHTDPELGSCAPSWRIEQGAKANSITGLSTITERQAVSRLSLCPPNPRHTASEYYEHERR